MPTGSVALTTTTYSFSVFVSSSKSSLPFVINWPVARSMANEFTSSSLGEDAATSV